MTADIESLAARYHAVMERIRAAELRAGRCENSVQLVAVSKLHSARAIRAVAEAGQVRFAENFVQEALSKQSELADLGIEWHFIGRIQSNKTREIAANFHWTHSVDRFKVAKRLSDQRPASADPLNVCLQVNLQAERSKAGVAADKAWALLDQTRELSGIKVRGLMIIPEPSEDVPAQRRVFARLRALRDEMNESGHSLDALSMGMTADMEAAIAEGATHVRVGTALFGQRPA